MNNLSLGAGDEENGRAVLGSAGMVLALSDGARGGAGFFGAPVVERAVRLAVTVVGGSRNREDGGPLGPGTSGDGKPGPGRPGTPEN